MTWQVVPDAVVAVRRRWQHAPDRLGPWSRHPRSIDLLRHAAADVRTLLAHLDVTRRDPLGELIHELAQMGATEIVVRAVRPLAGERAWHRVEWLSRSGARRDAEAWSTLAAVRKAIRAERAAPDPDSDANRSQEGAA